ncbi:MAG: dicarboxylate/amino acid:cation symporter [Gammaproteobacteria bacterium]|jgi:Na+/H+-dicarboxylate symporter
MKNNILLWGVLIGAIAGVFCGWFFGEAMSSIAWIGALFLDALKMMIVPLIVAAVITSITAIGDVRHLGKLGGITVLYYFCTTAIAVLIGLIIVNIVKPGVTTTTELSQSIPIEIVGKDATGIADIIQTLVTPNLINAAANSQILPLIVFCLIFGIALTTIGERGKTISGFFEGLNDVMMKLVIWLMYLSPVGIFALIASKLGETGGGEALLVEISKVGWYIFTVILALFIHFLFLSGVLIVLAKRGKKFILSMLRALITAFGTASSTATLPLTMECAIEAGVQKRVVKFVLPLGATVNMDGTALYEAVAVMFIAQAYGIDMTFTQQAIIFITATLAAIGAAGIPQAGLVTMALVLTAVNLPLEGVGLILAVDWFLDRIRTTVNVWGDSVGSAVIEKFYTSQDDYKAIN